MSIPEETPVNTEVALRNYATVRVLEKRLADVKGKARAYLQEHMVPGSRLVATLPDGSQVATVSRPADSEAKLQVTDMREFVAWLQTHEPMLADKVIMVPTLPEWVVAHGNLESLVEDNEGELPPGVGFTTPRASTPRCTMSQKQEDAFLAGVSELRAVAGLLEAGNDYE